jgi:uncharacterized membrane protein
MFTSLSKKLILFGAIAGTILSGYLSYQNYFIAGGCQKSWLSCGVGNTKVLIFGQPTCVYGLAFFIIALVLMLAWWKKSSRASVLTMMLLGLAGVLFAGSVGLYEIIGLKALEQGSMPACVYGFVFFAVILIAAAQSWMAKPTAITPTTPPPTELPKV